MTKKARTTKRGTHQQRVTARRVATTAVLVTLTVIATLALTWRIAAAAVGQTTIDPIGGAQASVDSAIQILTTYGPATGGMYLLFAVARALVNRYAKSSWLATGKRLAYVTSALGVAGAALQAQASGAPWTIVLSAAVAAAFKLITPTVPGQSGQSDVGHDPALPTPAPGNAAAEPPVADVDPVGGADSPDQPRAA